MSASGESTLVVERPQTTTPAIWHICTNDAHNGNCGPGCVAYCGKVNEGGRRSRTSAGVARIEICVICQGLSDG